ncbi:MAG: hypothetical protein HY914_06780 [Desulfomonile tiedjei]|nr:hypothetical protein [Desulfomonile tiedjei]
MRPIIPKGRPLCGLLLIVSVCGILFSPQVAWCETYGAKDAQGSFVAKVAVTVADKEVTIRKVDPREKFTAISLKLNAKNKDLIKNVASLELIWIGPGNKAGRPVPFAGPLYDRNTRTFTESMTKSVSVKIVDKSGQNLFVGKSFSELFTISVDKQTLVSSESASEEERTVQLGRGRDVSIQVDKTAIVFNQSNYKPGEMINVDNRTGVDQVIGIQLPEKSFVLAQLRRRLEQTKIPRENWDKFTLPADSGVFVALIPEPDPAQLRKLNGKEIVIRMLQGNEMREVRRIPIKVSPDLLSGAVELTPAEPSGGPEPKEPSAIGTGTSTGTVASPEAKPRPQTRQPAQGSQASRWRVLWDWAVPLLNLALLILLAVYSFFFMMPKIQVLEDRVVQSEMYIHGSREAMREELEQMKKEMVDQIRQESGRE